MGILFLAGGLSLAGLPPFGTFLGKGMIEDAAEKLGYAWVTVALIIASALTGGAVLRATGRVFAGWGPRRDDQEEASTRGDEKPEPQERETHTPPSFSSR